MQEYAFTNKNLKNIKEGFFRKINQEAPVMKKHKPLTVLLIAAVLVLSLSAGILASTDILQMSSIYKTFFGEGFENNGFNINTSFTANGIELKLLSAVVDGNNGYIFYSIQDLENDRLDENIGWNLGLNGQFYGGGTEVIYYDTETKTVFAVTRINSTKGISVNDKMIFTLRNLESGLQHYYDYETGIDIRALLSENEPVKIITLSEPDITSWSKPNDSKLGIKQIANFYWLEKDVLNISISGIDWAKISNIGLIDNKLHIQIKYTENRRSHNNGHFSLYKQNGEEIHAVYSITTGDTTYGYEEQVYEFDSYEELFNASLKAQFTSSAEYIEGPWTLDFKIGWKTEDKIIAIKSLENTSLKNVIVIASPISTTIKFNMERDNIFIKDINEAEKSLGIVSAIIEAGNYLVLKDESIIQLNFNSGPYDYEKNQGNIIYYNEIYDINELKSIMLNGIEYNFNAD